MKNKEELPMNLDRGAWQVPLEFAREDQWALKAKLFRPEPTDLALNDQPAVNGAPGDALREQVVAPNHPRPPRRNACPWPALLPRAGVFRRPLPPASPQAGKPKSTSRCEPTPWRMAGRRWG